MEWVHHDGTEACSSLVRPHILTKKQRHFSVFQRQKTLRLYSRFLVSTSTRFVGWYTDIQLVQARTGAKGVMLVILVMHLCWLCLMILINFDLFSVNAKLLKSFFFLFAEQNHYHFEAFCKSCNLQLQNLWETSSKTQQNQWKQSTWNPFTLHLLPPCSAGISEYAPNGSELERNRLDIEFNTEDVILSRW